MCAIVGPIAGGSQSCDRYIRVIIAKDYTHLRLTLRRDGFFDPV
jgi:hypothetical protein